MTIFDMLSHQDLTFEERIFLLDFLFRPILPETYTYLNRLAQELPERTLEASKDELM